MNLPLNIGESMAIDEKTYLEVTFRISTEFILLNCILYLTYVILLATILRRYWGKFQRTSSIYLFFPLVNFTVKTGIYIYSRIAFGNEKITSEHTERIRSIFLVLYPLNIIYYMLFLYIILKMYIVFILSVAKYRQ